MRLTPGRDVACAWGAAYSTHHDPHSWRSSPHMSSRKGRLARVGSSPRLIIGCGYDSRQVKRVRAVPHDHLRGEPYRIYVHMSRVIDVTVVTPNRTKRRIGISTGSSTGAGWMLPSTACTGGV